VHHCSYDIHWSPRMTNVTNMASNRNIRDFFRPLRSKKWVKTELIEQIKGLLDFPPSSPAALHLHIRGMERAYKSKMASYAPGSCTTGKIYTHHPTKRSFHVVNLCLIVARYYIYTAVKESECYSITAFKVLLKSKLSTEWPSVQTPVNF